MRGPADTRRRLLAATAGLAGATLLAGRTRAALQLDITRGFVEPMPIAVSPMAGDGPAGRERGEAIAALVAADLDGSGLFRTMATGQRPVNRLVVAVLGCLAVLENPPQR